MTVGFTASYLLHVLLTKHHFVEITYRLHPSDLVVFLSGAKVFLKTRCTLYRLDVSRAFRFILLLQCLRLFAALLVFYLDWLACMSKAFEISLVLRHLCLTLLLGWDQNSKGNNLFLICITLNIA